MPIYEYQCAKCGERFSVRQSMGQDSSKLNCPKCQAENPKKLISSFFGGSSGSSQISGSSCAGST